VTPTRPVLRYHGGKWKLAPWVLEHLPPHKVYVEPFCGAASVLLRKARSTSEILNDLDEEVVGFFRVLRDEPSALELARRLALTPFARAEYEDWCYGEPADAVDSAHRMICRSFMGMSSKGIWQRSGFDSRLNGDGFLSRVNALKAMPEVVLQVAERLRGVLIERDDAVKLIGRFQRDDCLLYCDPPYVKAARGRNSQIYRWDMSDEGHRRLAGALRAGKGMVVLSGYPCELYDKELYPDWHRVERSHVADNARATTEVLWLNQAAADALRARKAA
jgi:DNA adenine methylase